MSFSIREYFRIPRRSKHRSQKRRLCLEQLEMRDCPAISAIAFTDTFSNFANGRIEQLDAGILANDASPLQIPLKATLVQGPSHGTLSLNANGTFTYTPEPGFFGTDSFTYKAFNGIAYSNIASVFLNVPASNPVFNIADATSAYSIALGGNEYALEGQPYALSLSVADSGGDAVTQWSINWGDGTPTQTVAGTVDQATHVFRSPGNYTINATATFQDGSQETKSAFVTVQNVAPTITLNVTYGNRNWVTLSGQVSDTTTVSGLTVTFEGVVNTTTTTNEQGQFSITVQASALGQVRAKVTDIYDMDSAWASVTLTSQAPVICNFSATCQGGGVWTFHGNVSDESPAGLVIRLGGLPSLQNKVTTVMDNGTFSLTVELAAGEEGTATAQTTDWWSLNSNLATFTI